MLSLHQRIPKQCITVSTKILSRNQTKSSY